MTSNKDNTDSLLSSIPQLSKDNWFTFKDRSIALLESKDLLKYCDGSYDTYMEEKVYKTLKNGKRIKIARKQLLSEETLDKHRGEEVKAKGILRLLCNGSMYETISKLDSAKDIWTALLQEYESQSIYDKIYCLHDLFFTKLESESEEDVRKYLDNKALKFSEAGRMNLCLPKEMLPLFTLAGLSGPWKALLREYSSKENVTFEEVKRRIEIELQNKKQGIIGPEKHTALTVQKDPDNQEKCSHC
jgi:hypothetical protein